VRAISEDDAALLKSKRIKPAETQMLILQLGERSLDSRELTNRYLIYDGGGGITILRLFILG